MRKLIFSILCLLILSGCVGFFMGGAQSVASAISLFGLVVSELPMDNEHSDKPGPKQVDQ